MPDVFTKSKRSEVMSHIRSRGNKDTELALMAFFRRHKITGWRRHIRLQVLSPVTRHLSLSVRPDFVFPKSKLAVFVDGCFWHGCPKHGTKPKGNAAFWRKKLGGNKIRDRLVTRTLRKSGWRVLRLWEHALRRANKRRAPKHEAQLLSQFQDLLIRENPCCQADCQVEVRLRLRVTP